MSAQVSTETIEHFETETFSQFWPTDQFRNTKNTESFHKTLREYQNKMCFVFQIQILLIRCILKDLIEITN